MKRRDTIKTLIAGAAGGAIVTTGACKSDGTVTQAALPDLGVYGRTPEEIAHDKEVLSKTFFSDDEMATLRALSDIILPSDEMGPSATELEVPEFIEFIVKDLPYHQLPMRGGMMWLDAESNSRYEKKFSSLTKEQQTAIIDDIAYPEEVKPEYAQGAAFLNKARNLIMTGYFTTKVGVIDIIGYKGNMPNVWDGVPPEVLAKHDVDYDADWIAKCVDQDKRDVQAEWDDDMNLIT